MLPIHPAIVHFPPVLLILAVIIDLAGYIKSNVAWRDFGRWIMAAAFITAALAAVAGVVDMSRVTLDESIHDYIHLHMYIGIILLSMMAALTAWRWFSIAKAHAGYWRAYFVAAFLIIGLMGFQGWIGGELVFSYGIGVAAAEEGTEPQVQSRMDKVAKTLLPLFPRESADHSEINPAHQADDKPANGESGNSKQSEGGTEKGERKHPEHGQSP